MNITDADTLTFPTHLKQSNGFKVCYTFVCEEAEAILNKARENTQLINASSYTVSKLLKS